MPSGTPIATPPMARMMPSNTTSRASCPRIAPTARSMASVRERSPTPMLRVEKMMNVAATIETALPR